MRMGHSSSRPSSSSTSSSIPMKLEGQNTNPYDRFSDVDESGDVKIETTLRTSTRPMWKYTLVIFMVFIGILVAAGVSCVFEDACKNAYGIPDINRMSNSTRTSLYLMSAANTLVVVHLTEVYSVAQLVSERAPILGRLQSIAAAFIYMSIFINLSVNAFEMTLVVASMILCWMALVTEALRRFYVRGVSRLWAFTVPFVIGFAIATALYAVFMSLGSPFVHATLVVEILMVLSCVGFALMLIPHTRWVIVETVVKK